MQLKKPGFQIGSLIYLAINALYILPMALFLGHIETAANQFVGFYIITLGFYYLFFLTYAHIAFSIVVIMYGAGKFIKNKITSLFVVSLVITLINITVNVYWALCGREWTIQ